MRRFAMLFSALLFALVFMVQFAQAEIVHVEFSGQVEEWSDFETILEGSAFSGYYTYDDELSPYYCMGNHCFYKPVIFYIEFSDGSSVYSEEAKITVNNGSGDHPTDWYEVEAPTTIPINSPLITCTGAFNDPDLVDYLVVARIYATDDSGEVFGDTSLPDPILLSEMSWDREVIFFANHYGEGNEVPMLIWFRVTSISVSTSPQDMVQELVDSVMNLNIKEGISNSLDAKLEAVLNALDDLNEKNDVAAINSLEAFINAVEAQRGKELTDEQADDLVAQAQAIIEILSL